MDYSDNIVINQVKYALDYELRKTKMKDQEKTKEQLVIELEDMRQEKHGRKAEEEKLRESEEKYRVLVDNTSDFIYSFDRESRHTAVNQSICKALGLNAQDIIGKNHTDLGFPDDIVQEWKAVHQTVFTSKKVVKTETTTPMPDGSLHTYEVVLIPICDERGAVTGFRGTSRDITERKKAEEVLRKHQDHLEELVEERTAELTTANQKLQQEIIGRKRTEKEREKLISDLRVALVKIKTLSGIIPICAKCKKIRDDKGYWKQVEEYIRDHTEAEFSHGLCPECAAEMEKEIDEME
ncbi:MAG: PAS domain S-box protein [Planctomycetes bacterium]|nr:PAS domain S-box protein [Planctomycetota bacterium]